MGPRELQQKIHSTFSPIEGTWSSFKEEIEVFYAVHDKSELNSHLLREFNRKVLGLGFAGLAFSPYDGGYRFIGESIGGGGGSPDSGFVFVYDDLGNQVVLNDDSNVQVPEGEANA